MIKARYLELSKPKDGRRFAISDIHGCVESFKGILRQISLKTTDQLFLVGDLVNRGPSSDLVIDHYLKLKNDGFQIYFIRGNHDQTILNTHKKTIGQRKRILGTLYAQNLLENGFIKEKYLNAIQESYHYIKLDDFYLVHAGFNFKSANPFENVYAMMNTRSFKAKKKFLEGRRIIIGHTPKDLAKIMRKIKKGKRKLYIDNGCVNYKTRGQGNLICLNLDSMAISVQKNLDY